MAGVDHLREPRRRHDVDEAMEQFDVTRGQVHAVVEFVARCLDGTPRADPVECWLCSRAAPRLV